MHRCRTRDPDRASLASPIREGRTGIPANGPVRMGHHPCGRTLRRWPTTGLKVRRNTALQHEPGHRWQGEPASNRVGHPRGSHRDVRPARAAAIRRDEALKVRSCASVHVGNAYAAFVSGLASLHGCTVRLITTPPPGTNDPSTQSAQRLRWRAKLLQPPGRRGRHLGGGGRESNPPGHFRTLIGFEDRGTHQASGRLREGRYPTR